MGRSGGLVCARKGGIEVEIIMENQNHIAVLVRNDPTGSPWVISLIYGPPTVEIKGSSGKV